MTGSVPQFIRRGNQGVLPTVSQEAASDASNLAYTYWSVTDDDPLPVTTISSASVGGTGGNGVAVVTPVLNVAGTFLLVNARRRGCRIVNWLNKPVYIMGQSPIGAPGPDPTPLTGYSDFVPACNGVPGAGGIPGQYVFDYAPVNPWRYLVNEAFTGPGFTVIQW